MKHIFATILLTLVLCACSDSDRFTIRAKIDGLGEQSVTLTYYADGAVNQVVAQPDKHGELKFAGRASQPTLFDLTVTSSGEPLVLLPVRNGQHLKLEFPLSDPLAIKVKGSREAEETAEFLSDRATLIKEGRPSELNLRIKEYVLTHRSSLSSTVLMVSRFDCSQAQLADSLLNVLDPEVRPLNLIQNFTSVISSSAQSYDSRRITAFRFVGERDSVYSYAPKDQAYTLLIFPPGGSDRRATIDTLKRLSRDFSQRRLRIVEISLRSDSSAWRHSLRSDSATWDRVWVPGSASNSMIKRMRISSQPFYIVADSTGTLLLRTGSLREMSRTVRERM